MSILLPDQLVIPAVQLVSRWTFSPRSDWTTIRRRQTAVTRWPGAPSSVCCESVVLAGRPAEIYRSRSGTPASAVLYLHGGGYTTGSVRTHRGLTGRLAATMGATVYSLDYRLAPEHRHSSALDDATAAYRQLRRQWSAEQLVIAGDSAGAALALGVALRLRDSGEPLPAAVGLICPATDFRAATIAELPDRGRDAILTKDLVLRFLGAAGADQHSADVSPGLADLSGLLPLVIETASNDLIVGMARDLAGRARASGVTVSYREHDGKCHVFHVLAGVWSQADRAVDAFAADLVGQLQADRRAA